VNLFFPRFPTALSRRHLLRGAAVTAAWAATPGAFAEALVQTPRQTEGPFYPDQLPLDTDNDLIVINENLTPSVGEIAYVSGRILDAKGDPVRNAVVEIWQCDATGAYLHSKDTNKAKQDKNFQGFGRFVTGSTGEYLFRTIKPVPYPGRTPHIHYKVKRAGKELLTTQLYIQGHPGNEKDGIWKNIKDAKDRAAVTKEFKPLKGAKAGELVAKFDLVLGVTPEV
jgi:protocatechuate 3,4-dioxygenase, beta subunit